MQLSIKIIDQSFKIYSLCEQNYMLNFLFILKICFISCFSHTNLLKASFLIIKLMINDEIHLYMMLIMNLLILFCVWIEVRRVKRSQFDAVWMMLERCVIMKAVMQSFHLRNNTLSNSHNWSMKKINDMSKSVRDEKILLVEKSIQMMSLRLWLQVIEELMTHQLRWYTETSSSHQQCCRVIDEKISDKIIDSDDESWVHDYMCSKK